MDGTKPTRIVSIIRMTLAVLLSFFIFVPRVQAATLYLSPNTGTFAQGTHFTMSVMVSTNQAMNGVDAVVQFPTNKLQVISVSKQNSIFNLWVQEPSFSNLGPVGTVHFQGVALNPGFIGSEGKVLDIIFRVKDTGPADITYGNGAVLANDGRGTNIISSFGSAVYTLREGGVDTGTVPRVIGGLPPLPTVRQFLIDRDGKDLLFNTSDEKPKWNNSVYTKLTWDLPQDVTGVSMLLDDKPDSDPGPVSDGLVDERVFPLMAEGKQYFHIRFINQAGKGEVFHYPLLTDIHPPKYFSIDFPNTEANYHGIYTTSNPKPFIDFFTVDELSGIERYEIKVGEGDWQRADDLKTKGLYRLPKLSSSKRQTFTVRAIDAAGNFTDATAQVFIEPIAPPVITYISDNISFPKQDLIIEGSSTPFAEVELVLKKDEPYSITVRADGDGVWRLIHSGIRSSGAYSVVARQMIGNGAESDFSTPSVFYATSGFFSWWTRLNLGRMLPWIEHLLVLLVLVQFIRVWWTRKQQPAILVSSPVERSSTLLTRPTRYALKAGLATGSNTMPKHSQKKKKTTTPKRARPSI